MALIVWSGVLVGCAGFGMYKIPHAGNPWAITACTLGLCQGLLQLYNNFTDNDESDQFAKAMGQLMEIVPLPLVNIELYLKSDTPNIALGHGIHILPFCLFPLIKKIQKPEASEEDEEALETLRRMTILGNVYSLVFLAINEESNLYAGIAVAAFSSKYVAMWIELQIEGTEYCFTTFFSSVFFLLTALALGENL